MQVRAGWLRIAGLILLGLLLWKLDSSAVFSVMRRTAPAFLVLAILLNLPQIFLKALRWRFLMFAQGIRYSTLNASLSYFGSIFVGLLTPGRLGEFVKTIHVSRDCDIPAARAFPSVLVDRLFDLYALLLFGGAALLSGAQQKSNALLFAESALLLIVPMIAILHGATFERIQSWAIRAGKLGKKLFDEGSWLQELRLFLLTLRWNHILVALLLTSFAYVIFFGQCYLLALGLGMEIEFLKICFAVSLGSLVTLIPISISGLGTREAVMIAYLGTAGISPELSLGYSLLVFVTFYVAGGLIGAI
ncbi:flippase-like domain-containing protein, partial [bacterium]|nr:flippase-like domain-containing protein [bacterium]